MSKKDAPHTHHESARLEETMLHNLVELQKINTHLAERFDKLSYQISQLLALFEGAAKSFSSHVPDTISEKDRDFLDKIDKLLEQNKTIAKGLMLMEERMRDRVHSPQQRFQPGLPESPRPLPRI